ncbi:HlyD family secretion protein [Aquicella lusitana]|uniref:HlyD family secretion protein n=1 Tax=Aquicella lusitana TaxID=254246 RepID=A0A370GT85_9COXI|nr:efflux RND transporter periplasmic adaptor subunit [Aquicella lusitana]RDI46908.1 HlyD family secretion protein [Aquicella lusitana]VVC73799.1 Macrolide export protein MacA [Aquicella lusitana]
MRFIRQASILLVCILFASGCSRQPEHAEAQGYIEGSYTYMATSVSGVVEQLLVKRGDKVKQGQRLFVLEQQPESDAYQAAQENLKQAVASRDATAANLAFAKITYERYKILVPKNAIERSQLDSAKSNYNALIAQLAQANANIASSKAALAQAKWTKEQKTINAPVEAVVFDTYYRLGEYAAANEAILSLLAPGNVKAVFFVSESQLGGIRVNDQIKLACDGCTQSYTGKITFISPSAEYTPPVIYSTETNEKLVYRVEARFAPEDAYQLHPGQPIYVTYYPRKQG